MLSPFVRVVTLNIRYSISILLLCFFIPFSILAGPPFRTDDPEPVEYQHWEFYLASQLTKDNAELSGTVPYAEANYGIIPGMHIHLNIPMAIYQPETGKSAYGFGDIELGLKCRLVNETNILPQISTYPALEIPTGNAGKHLGAGAVQFFIPLWLQKSWNSWATYCGGGYMINTTTRSDNSVFLGWEAQHDFSGFLTIGAEFFSTLIPSNNAENEFACNFGAIVNVNENNHILLSIGRDIAGSNDIFCFAAYQLTIGVGQNQ